MKIVELFTRPLLDEPLERLIMSAEGESCIAVKLSGTRDRGRLIPMGYILTF